MRAQIATVTLSVVLSFCGPGLAVAQPSLETLARGSPVEVLEARPSTTTARAARRTPAVKSQTTPDMSSSDMKVSIYPVFVWVPAFSATTNVPSFPDVPDGPDLPGGSGSTSASFDGAALAGFSIEKSRWRVDVDGIWAALGTQRDRPLLNVDLDLIYGHATGGVEVANGLYVTGGVRRLALKYDIELGDRLRHFVRKPGIWDPLVGLAWHGAAGSRLTLHVAGEGGGFGAGADVDLAGSVRTDLKLTKHFGLALGYSVLYLKLSDTALQRTFEVKQTLHGPTFGLGFYF